MSSDSLFVPKSIVTGRVRWGGTPPPARASVTAIRDTDRRNAIVAWTPVPGAVGYNVRWGIRPDRLYETYQIFADRETRLEVRAFNVDQRYFLGVEAFNETGVSPLSAIVESQ